MKSIKINLTIDSVLLSKARKFAAKKGISVGELVSCQLKKAMRERKGYNQARRSALARLRCGFDLRWKPASSSDELHHR